MELFYTPDDPKEFLELSPEESRHLIKVMRAGPGDEILLTNGKGNLYHATIESMMAGKCRVRIVETKNNVGKRPFKLHIGIAPTKNTERLEWFLEKATEIGIDEITPMICRHSERRTLNLERMQKVVIAAMKQSQKTYLPVINPVSSFAEILQSRLAKQKFICTMEASILFQDACKPAQDSIVLIGPEGDFHPEEMDIAKQAGFQSASLGSSRLRTETAGIVVCADFALINP